MNLIDYLGEAVEVIRNGNRVTLNFYNVYHGKGATASTIKRFNNAIQSAWSNRFGRFNVTANVLTPTSSTPPELINTIHITQSGNYGEVFNRPGTDQPGNTARIGANMSDWGVAHDAGHLAGLKDPAERWTTEGVTRDDPDIMDVHGKPPLERTIEAIIEKNQAEEPDKDEESGSSEWSEFSGSITGVACRSVILGC